jgi:hypothetical protein
MNPADIKHLSLDTEKHPEKEDLGGAASVTSTEATAHEEGIQPIFLAKVRVLNDALAECGMGKYPPLLLDASCLRVNPILIVCDTM